MKRRLLSVFFLLIAAGLLGAPSRAASLLATAQDPPPEEEASEQEPAAEETQEPAEEEVEVEEELESEYLAVVGGDVYTVTDGVIAGGTVLLHKDRIEAVGALVAVPEGAEVIDARGMHVYPGLVAVNASGILRGSGKAALDSFDPYSLTVDLMLAGGITTVQSGGAVAKLTRGSLDGTLVQTDTWVSLNYSSSAPSSRRRLREGLDQARDFLRRKRAHELDKSLGREPGEEPSDEGVEERYRKLLEGSATARFSASSLKDLLAICDLLESYPMKAVIFGGQEAWTCAPRLGRSGVWLVITPRAKRWADENLNRPSGWSIENARILHEAGVEFAILPSRTFVSTGGTAGRDLLTLPLEAAFAIRGGLPQSAALRCLTINAAKILGLEDRIGSLEPGKDADLIVTDGDLFDYRTFVQWAVVNGRVVYDKQRASYFAHIRPRPEPQPDELLEELRKAFGGEEVVEDDAAAEARPDDPESDR